MQGRQNHCNFIVSLLRSGIFNGTSTFLWRSDLLIRRFEIIHYTTDDDDTLNPTPPPTQPDPAVVIRVHGGLQHDFLQLWTDDDAHAVATRVRIYSRPTHAFFGQPTDNTELANATLIAGRAPLELHYVGSAIVRAVHCYDQTNGTGAYVAYIDGIGTRAVYVQFRSQLPHGGRIDYRLEFHADRPFGGYETFYVGRMQAHSERIESLLLLAERADGAEEPAALLDAAGGYSYRMPADYRLDLARLTDASAGECDRVLDAAERADLTLYVRFARTRGCVRFRLDVYGQWGSEWTLIVGQRLADSELLWVERVDVVGERETRVLQTERLIDRIEVRNVERDGRVRARLVTGEVGGRVVVVMFEADETWRMHFEVMVWVRPE